MNLSKHIFNTIDKSNESKIYKMLKFNIANTVLTDGQFSNNNRQKTSKNQITRIRINLSQEIRDDSNSKNKSTNFKKLEGQNTKSSNPNYKLPQNTFKIKQSNANTSYRWKKGEVLSGVYQLVSLLGKGSFGEVIKALDRQKNQFIAIKIIRKQFQYQKLAEDQIKILLELRDLDKQGNKGIVKFKNFFKHEKHMCLVFELLSLNLYEILELNNFVGLHVDIVRKISIQILTALKFLGQNSIIHADLKPENILFKQLNKTGIKIIDFGTSMRSNRIYFDYIMSRFYRAPEVIIGHPFNEAIDMWSAGCIIIQMLIGLPIFPGHNQKEQLFYIIQTIGLPDEKYLSKCKRKLTYFDQNNNLIQPLTIKNRTSRPLGRPFASIYNNQLFLNFISKILTWDTTQRYTPQQALLDPWILEGLPAQLIPEHIRNIKNSHRLKHSITNNLVLKHRRRVSDLVH